MFEGSPKLNDRMNALILNNAKLTTEIIKISEDNEQSANQLWFLNQG